MTAEKPKANRLIEETSPYLLQHAYNPVDWHAWNADALRKAQQEEKPILLSIGYSACHWCHVMERESFEDERIARVMNELYICIKVDREERPDLDKIYQLAHQMFTQRAGGWPLTIILTPAEHAPIFAGTYFPPEPRFGMPSFSDVLYRVADHYRTHRPKMAEHAAAIKETFARLELPPVDTNRADDFSGAILDTTYRELKRQYDPVNGGFGAAPKFPHPHNVDWLLRHSTRSGQRQTSGNEALNMVTKTLHAMASGGMYDQLAGGFCRYSVDEKWRIPHFEKMLYDNAQLLALYTDGAVRTGDPALRRVAEDTAAWVIRDMQSADGGYYSTLDADSEGEEGKFYVWGADEIHGLLSDDEWQVTAARYGLDAAPNFEGKWHLNVAAPVPAIAERIGLSTDAASSLLDSARRKLLAHREQRIWPNRDDKILTSWNGLMIKGVVRAGRFLNRPDFVESARRALGFIRNVLWRDGRLLATARDGRAHLNGYLDDYVLMADAALELCQAEWCSEWFRFAIELVDSACEHFEDKSGGGFYFTSNDHEQLLHRYKPSADDDTPSGNGTAALVMLRLGYVLGETRYTEVARRTLASLLPNIHQFPSGHCSLLNAIGELLTPSQTIVIRGEDPEDLERWKRWCHDQYAPRRLVFAIPDDATQLPESLARYTSLDGMTTAYVCDGFTCLAPIGDPKHFHAEITGKTSQAN